MDNEKWEELDLRATSTIHIHLAKNILVNVLGTLSGKELWEKLEGSRRFFHIAIVVSVFISLVLAHPHRIEKVLGFSCWG
ncbi:hypothetical protein KIW84_070392 [Lathyrus oleraceus]|uniref:Uncharacterized protein n=1 Tax=Pisum sativum TaxID=3888 RepID=A0A9D4VGL1_PEA|nr:hypothetical protein KIW84_070392 [Pisum sativum]